MTPPSTSTSTAAPLRHIATMLASALLLCPPESRCKGQGWGQTSNVAVEGNVSVSRPITSPQRIDLASLFIGQSSGSLEQLREEVAARGRTVSDEESTRACASDRDDPRTCAGSMDVSVKVNVEGKVDVCRIGLVCVVDISVAQVPAIASPGIPARDGSAMSGSPLGHRPLEAATRLPRSARAATGERATSQNHA